MSLQNLKKKETMELKNLDIHIGKLNKHQPTAVNKFETTIRVYKTLKKKETMELITLDIQTDQFP